MANKGKYPPGTACIFWGRRFRTEQLELREALQEAAELAQDEDRDAT